MSANQQMLLGARVVPKVYTAWNPSDKNAALTLSGSNLIASTSTDGGVYSLRADQGKATGKLYFEIVYTYVDDANGVAARCGVANSSALLTAGNAIGKDANGWSIGSNGFIQHSNVSTDGGVTFASGNTLNVAWDADAGKLWFGRNGAWILSGDPAAGTNPNYTSVTGTLYPAGGVNCSSGRPDPTITLAPGPTLGYTPPSGFSAGWFL